MKKKLLIENGFINIVIFILISILMKSLVDDAFTYFKNKEIQKKK